MANETGPLNSTANGKTERYNEYCVRQGEMRERPAAVVRENRCLLRRPIDVSADRTTVKPLFTYGTTA